MDRYTTTLLSRIDAFRAAYGMSETAFGVGALNDNKLIRNIREGRSPTTRTIEKIDAFMAAYSTDFFPSAATSQADTQAGGAGDRAECRRPLLRDGGSA